MLIHHIIQNTATSLTTLRLTKYLVCVNGDLSKALDLYNMNSSIAASLFIDLHFLEITLRNKLSSELKKVFGENWFQNSNFINLVIHDLYTIDNLDQAIKKAQKKTTKYLEGHVISDLSFGFWINLLAKKYTQPLWIPIFSHCFQGKKPARKDFHKCLDDIREIRNRIAHHDPIFHLDIADYFQRIHESLFLLDPDTANYMKHHSNTLSHLDKIKAQRPSNQAIAVT